MRELAPVLRFGDRNLIHFIGKRSVKDGKREAVADRESVDRKKLCFYKTAVARISRSASPARRSEGWFLPESGAGLRAASSVP